MSMLGDIGEVIAIRRIEAKKWSVDWQIRDFLSLVVESEEYYFSPDFICGDELWSMAIWAKWGDETENPSLGCVRLDLIRCFKGPPKTFQASVSIKGSEGIAMEREVEREFSHEGDWYSWEDFCPRSQLIKHKSRLMPRNILTITCVLNNIIPGTFRDRCTQTCIPSQHLTELKQSSKEREQQSPDQCAICYEKPVDSVLYRCGHMCMCYDCAFKLWKSKSSQCPVCRVSIQDVIKVYK